MKKFYLFLFLLLSTITACKKDGGHEPLLQNDNQKHYRVSFNTIFDQSVDNFKSSALPKISNDWNYGGNRVYSLDRMGYPYKLVDSLSLPPGNYVAVFLKGSFSRLYGYGGGLEFSSIEHASYNQITFDTRISVAAQSFATPEIFYKKVFFTIADKDIKQTVVLDRLVAGLEVDVQDVLPPHVSRLEVTVDDVVTYAIKSDARGSVVPKVYNYSLSQQHSLTAHVLNTGPVTVTIRAYDNRGLRIVSKSVLATFVPNKKTRLAGKLFTSGDFAVAVDSEWETPPPPIPF